MLLKREGISYDSYNIYGYTWSSTGPIFIPSGLFHSVCGWAIKRDYKKSDKKNYLNIF